MRVAEEHPIASVGANLTPIMALLAKRAGLQGYLPVRRRSGRRLRWLAGPGHHRGWIMMVLTDVPPHSNRRCMRSTAAG